MTLTRETSIMTKNFPQLSFGKTRSDPPSAKACTSSSASLLMRRPPVWTRLAALRDSARATKRGSLLSRHRSDQVLGPRAGNGAAAGGGRRARRLQRESACSSPCMSIPSLACREGSWRNSALPRDQGPREPPGGQARQHLTGVPTAGCRPTGRRRRPWGRGRGLGRLRESGTAACMPHDARREGPGDDGDVVRSDAEAPAALGAPIVPRRLATVTAVARSLPSGTVSPCPGRSAPPPAAAAEEASKAAESLAASAGSESVDSRGRLFRPRCPGATTAPVGGTACRNLLVVPLAPDPAGSRPCSQFRR